MENLNAFKQFLTNKFNKGGDKNTYSPSFKIRQFIALKEGSSMYSPAPDTGKVNRSINSMADDFWRVLPLNTKDYLLKNHDLADALFSYAYNIGIGNFAKRTLPTLNKFINGLADVNELERNMWASKDFLSNSPTYAGGLTNRRNEERALVHAAVTGSNKGAFESNKNFDYRYDPTIGIYNPSRDVASFHTINNPDLNVYTTPQITPAAIITSNNEIFPMYSEEEFNTPVEDIAYLEYIPINNTLLGEVEITPLNENSLYIEVPQYIPLIPIINYTSLQIIPLLEILEIPQISLYDTLVLQDINRDRALYDYNTLYGDLYDLFLSPEEADRRRKLDLEDLKFTLSINNISALGGLLFDSITNTYNPNNRIGDFVGSNKLPNVRY